MQTALTVEALTEAGLPEGEATSMVTTMQTAGDPFGAQRLKHTVDMLHSIRQAMGTA